MAWGIRKHKKKNFIKITRRNETYSDNLAYGMWDSQNGISRASLLQLFEVLKLGQGRLADGVDLARRNLDFADLDYLTISGDFHGSHETAINFSSCRNLALVHGGLHHVTFTCCVVTDFHCFESRIQDFIFNNSDLHELQVRNSTINGIAFNNSRVAAPIIERTEIQRLRYNPGPSWLDYSREADVCRRFRSAFQNIGRRGEASEFFYKERCLDRKALWSPYIKYRSEFPNRKYAGRLKALWKYWSEKHFNSQKSFELLLDLVWFHMKVWLIPKYGAKSFKYKIQYLVSLFEYLVWGYGEKPSRVIAVAAFSMIAFACIFYLYGPTKSNGIDSVYFSVVTFTTLGYGDIHPTDEKMKLLSALEALIGALSIGLLIGGFANKSRY